MTILTPVYSAGKMCVYRRSGRLGAGVKRYVVGPTDRPVLLEDFARLRPAKRWADENKQG